MELTNEILDHLEAALKAYKTPDNAKLTNEAMQLLGILASSMSCMYMHDHITQSDMCEWHNEPPHRTQPHLTAYTPPLVTEG